ncbi:hypothetical protein FQN55_005076 [Onygenales sp. PD_40]|nr:hypothetical protein FQN55_005076 [Onygenales sp. PD_40]
MAPRFDARRAATSEISDDAASNIEMQPQPPTQSLQLPQLILSSSCDIDTPPYQSQVGGTSTEQDNYQGGQRAAAPMESHEGNPKAPANNNVAQPPPNPPSIEAAYKKKCIALKKRLNEVQESNFEMQQRNEMGLRYIKKMRLESCILLERLAALTGMAEEQGISTELRARNAALLKEMGPQNTGRVGGAESRAPEPFRASYGIDFMDDGTEGSSEGHPPTPQERPLRVKRNRRGEDSSAPLDTADKDVEPIHSTLPTLLPATRPRSPPSHDHEPSSTTRFEPYNRAPLAMGPSPQPPPFASSPNAPTANHHRQHSGGYGIPDQPHRYISAFEDFNNRNRGKVINDLREAYGSETNITDDDIDRALADHWESLDPAEKRAYGDRRENRGGDRL